MPEYEAMIAHIQFQRDDIRGEDGAIWFLILGAPNENVVCSLHPKREHHYERQAFRLGSHGYRLDATAKEISSDQAHVWGWDGNVVQPTITPSFLAEVHRPYRMHSYVKRGQLELCNDSTVVQSGQQSCWGTD